MNRSGTKYNFPVRFSVNAAYQAVNPTDRAFILDAPINGKNRMKTKTTKRINKSAWIRKQAKKLSAKEIVAKAKAEGISISEAYVYVARNNAKNASSKPAVAKLGRSRKVDAQTSDAQRQFLALVVRLGTDEAQRLLTNAPTMATPRAKTAIKPVKTLMNHVTSNSVGQA